MSDNIALPLPENSPAFLSRLRAGRFTSPAGVESSFLFDELARSRDKSTSSHNIADSDISILQDLGSSMQAFTFSVYFVGANCDIEADTFYDSLFERYTPDKPGTLNHPRWGDLPVIPFGTPAQSESYVSGGGISRITVEFRETASVKAVQSAALSAADVAESAGQAKESALSRAADIAKSATTPAAKAYSKFRAVVKSKVSIIKNAIDDITGLTDDVRLEVEAIHQGILDALTIGATPAIILGQIDAMIETVASIPQDTANLATSLFDMTAGVIDSFGVDLASAKTSDDVKSIGSTYQSIATSCVSYSGVSSLAIDYTTRDQVGSSIDSLVDIYSQYTAQMSAIASVSARKISGVFIPDTDIERLVHGIIFDTSAILLSRAFSLKSRRLYLLDHQTDPMTETWTHYGSIDFLEFFCKTNNIIGSEFIELQAGRTLVFYE